MSNSAYETTLKFNYSFQLILCWLIISGGLGYSVMINHYAQLKNKVLSKLSKFAFLNIIHKKERIATTINTRIILMTTIILLLGGTGLFLFAESSGVLQEHHFMGKLVVSFFNSTTARTAGFNNVNMAELGVPALMLIMLLMWIGASPGSTGGGIKTTTFAVALLNLWNQIKGNDRLIVNLKEIPSAAINQVNAVILLSIFAISLGTFFLAVFEPIIAFKSLLFEVISAYSTVGLSVGITGQLSDASQVTLIFIMFLGRVSFLTFLIGVFSKMAMGKKGTRPYYPKENVFIN